MLEGMLPEGWMDRLTLTDEPVDESMLPPPGSPVKVVRSVRLPFEVDERLVALARDRNMTPSELARQFVETAISAIDHPGQSLVALDTVISAVQEALRQVPTIAA